mmetsp:Transcript_5376/g.7381  ORF Transcript_5376/g.7381 Transcript_5376/m.7381 type:complete len:80 (+) Transcript_5376:1764-2003(+)
MKAKIVFSGEIKCRMFTGGVKFNDPLIFELKCSSQDDKQYYKFPLGIHVQASRENVRRQVKKYGISGGLLEKCISSKYQ